MELEQDLRKNSMLYWFPFIENLEPLKIPRTILVEVGEPELLDFLLDQHIPPEWVHKFKVAAREIGYPVFIRTDECSGKHNWKDTCFVPSEDRLLRNIYRLIEDNEGMMGLHYTALVFREMILTESVFTAFRGEMPVTKERRYFVKDGEVLCSHPYWVPDAIAQWGDPEPRDDSEIEEMFELLPTETVEKLTKRKKLLPDNWRELLETVNTSSTKDLEHLLFLAKHVSEHIPGYWSVDFLCDAEGNWWLIDMALGQDSYHWDGCEHKLDIPHSMDALMKKLAGDKDA